MPTFEIIAFDADDTLWHYERLYAKMQAKIIKLLERTAGLFYPFEENFLVYAHL